MTRFLISIAFACCLVVVGACEKTTHENIDKWMTSKKGMGKLKGALGDGSLDPDLSAHAAENLVRKLEDATVREAFERMNPARRDQVLPKFVERMWKLARVEGEMARPTQMQELSKDMLFDARAWADPATKEKIDSYLIDWLTGGYYEGRAEAGRHLGPQIIRVLGPRAGEGLIAQANRIIATPDQDGRRRRIGDQLLLGLAVSGSPDAVKLLLDIFGMDRGDKSLPERVMTALYRAYLDSAKAWDLADPAALQPHLARIGEIARDDRYSAQVNNDATALIRASGLPGCLDPLVAMINHPHRDPNFIWVGVNNALKCGGPDALARVAEALPTGGKYERAKLGGSTWETFASIGKRDGFIAAAKALLASKSWVARWIAVETLGALSARSEAAAVAALAKDKARLAGYWGDQEELPKAERKPEPTLGQRATEIAGTLK